jgi:protein-tyrosine phosphatase
LADDIHRWQALGVGGVVSLLTAEEAADLDLGREAQECQAAGLRFFQLPIPDRGVPPSRPAAAQLVEQLDQFLRDGGNLGIHCRQGIGRSSLVTALLLLGAGLDPETAWNRIGGVRGCPVPETAEQRQWVARFGRTPQTLPSE